MIWRFRYVGASTWNYVSEAIVSAPSEAAARAVFGGKSEDWSVARVDLDDDEPAVLLSCWQGDPG